MDFFFLSTELSDSDSYIHFTNILDTDMHFFPVSHSSVSVHFVPVCASIPLEGRTCTTGPILMTFVPQRLVG